MKTLLITGNMGSGKSSFINKIFMSQGIPLTGIRSVRHFENHKFIGYDLSIIENYKTIKRWKIARIKGEKMLINPNFKPATEFLNNIQNKNLIFIDEIGRFERNDEEYLTAVRSLVNSDIKSIISLKKEDLPFNNNLIDLSKKDKDIEFFDLDDTDLRDLDLVLQEFSFKNILQKKVAIFYDDEARINLKNNISSEGKICRAGLKNISNYLSKGILKNIEFKRIDDIFNLTYDEYSKRLNDNYIIYCYTHNIDKMKLTSDIGLIPIKSLSEIIS